MITILMRLNKYILGDLTSNVIGGFNLEYYNSLIKRLEAQDTPFNRSFLQYKAQTFKNNKIIILNLLLLLLLPIFIFFPLFLMLFRKNINQEKYDYIAILPYTEIIPNKLKKANGLIISLKKVGQNITLSDVVYMYALIFKSLFYPYFLFKNIYIIFKYSGIAKMRTSEILVSNEYSFTSSILTDYLNQNDKKVSNCMHGEKVLCLRDCFSYYNHFYVWDEYYVKLLQSMNVKATFVIDICDFIRIDTSHSGEDIVFFLQGFETEDMLKSIREKLRILANLHNKKYYVKAHPRYLNDNLVQIFNEDEILSIDFIDAVRRSAIVASNYSTVLFQVYVNREQNHHSYPLIAINDLIKLPEKYIMISKSDIKFSELDKS